MNKCPECQKAGLRSKVRGARRGAATAPFTIWINNDQFWDEDGEYHDHTVYIEKYECSNGHEWSSDNKQKCSAPNCDWNEDRQT